MENDQEMETLNKVIKHNQDNINNCFCVVFMEDGETTDEAIARTERETGKKPATGTTLAIVKFIGKK